MSGYPGPRKPPSANCEDYCPKRGPALRHAHSSTCTENHAPNRCCSCLTAFVHAVHCRHENRSDEEGDVGDDIALPEDDRTIPRAERPGDKENPWRLIGMTPQQEVELLERTLSPRMFERLRFFQWFYQNKDRLK